MMTATRPAAKTARFPHTVIRASAGSGKTFQLTNRYLGLLLDGVPPEKILAVTFTRKAAGEILDRILLRLAEAAASDAKRQQLAKHLGLSDLTAKRCTDLLMSITRALHRVRVSTLDSFFSKIAGSCSLELGLPLGWRIVDDLPDQRLRDRAIAESLAGDSVKPVLTLLNLLAKGDVVRGVSQLIRDTVDRLYGVARETSEAVWTRLPRHKALPDAEFAECRRLLETVIFDHKKVMEEIEKDCQYLDDGLYFDFIRRGLPSKILDGVKVYQRKPITDDVRELYEKLLQQARFKLVNRLADQNEATYALLSHFAVHYERLKHSRAALRFEDITFALSRINDGIADDDRVSFRLDAPIDHLLLDEFQDTSLGQWRVLRPIAQRVTSAKGGTSFFCVGDTKQAIFGWRGGLTELFDAVEEELDGIQSDSLTTSNRSAPAIIDVVNRTFTNLHKHEGLDEYESAVAHWQKQFPEHTTRQTNLAGYATLEAAERVTVDRESGLDPEDVAEDAFLDFAAGRIAEIHRAAPGMSVGVLTRTNKRIGGLIYRLRKLGVAASEEGGNPLVDSCAVELVLSLLRLADHPGNSAAAYHIARSPLAAEFGLTPESLRHTGLAAARLRRELIDHDYGPTIARWAQLLAPACDERDRNRLQQLVELAYAYQSESTLRPMEFVQYIEEKRVADPSTAPVRIMTVHMAKGLEFDIVVLPELDSGRTLLGLPPTVVSSRDRRGGDIDCVCRYTNMHEQKLLPKSFQEMFRSATQAHIGEALCVMYVAMTRAIHALHMLIEPKENGRTPKTFAGLLRAALCEGEAKNGSGLLFSHGDPNWYEVERQRRGLEPRAISPPPAAAPALITLAPPLTQRRRGLERLNPSLLEGGVAARVRRALELDDSQRRNAKLRGTIIHAWFEQIAWLEDGAPSDDQLLAALAKIRGIEATADPVRRAFLKDFRAMLQRTKIAAALTRASYLKSLPQGWSSADIELQVHNERPFAIVRDGQINSGRIDRVVFHVRNGQIVAADILDFKTDAIADAPGERLADLREHYRPQLEEYCRTVMQQTGLPRSQVSAALLFVGEGEVVRLD